MPRRTGSSRKPKISETEVGTAAVTWLRLQGYKVWQEVALGGGSKSCDIVARRGKATLALECKTSINISLVRQCIRWRDWAHIVYAVVPYREVEREDKILFKSLGIGLVTVYTKRDRAEGASVSVEPAVNPNAKPERWDRFLRDEDADTCTAGSQSGRVTPFAATKRALTAWVLANPGRPCREAVAAVKHHYRTNASAESCTLKMIVKGVYEGIRLEKPAKGRGWVLVPA